MQQLRWGRRHRLRRLKTFEEDERRRDVVVGKVWRSSRLALCGCYLLSRSVFILLQNLGNWHGICLLCFQAASLKRINIWFRSLKEIGFRINRQRASNMLGFRVTILKLSKTLLANIKTYTQPLITFNPNQSMFWWKILPNDEWRVSSMTFSSVDIWPRVEPCLEVEHDAIEGRIPRSGRQQASIHSWLGYVRSSGLWSW